MCALSLCIFKMAGRITVHMAEAFDLVDMLKIIRVKTGWFLIDSKEMDLVQNDNKHKGSKFYYYFPVSKTVKYPNFD
jgi:hypothetical protein